MKNRFRFSRPLVVFALYLGLWSCENSQEGHDPSLPQGKETAQAMYTCPMPEDSVFSEKPGKCPKCGMELIKVEPEKTVHYSCPMHPEVVSDEPGNCPKCGMELETLPSKKKVDTLASLIQPTNHFVVSKLQAIIPSADKGSKTIAVEGYLTYNPDNASSISAKVSGRIERLFVKSDFEQVKKGEKLLEIYSPELQTAQNEWLYVMKSKDAADRMAQQALRARLQNLGMDEASISQLQETGKVKPFVPLYANAKGHVHFLNGTTDIASHAFGLPNSSNDMTNNGREGEEQTVLREGDYVKKGDVLFAIADPSSSWALFKIMPSDVASVKKGQGVEVAIGNQQWKGKVDFIEKSFGDFYTVRVYLRSHDHHKWKVGSLVKGVITQNEGNKSLWVPASAVLSLGKDKSAVFVKKAVGYAAKEIRTGSLEGDWVEIVSGLTQGDSIAPVASYLVDSEAFIRTE